MLEVFLEIMIMACFSVLFIIALASIIIPLVLLIKDRKNERDLIDNRSFYPAIVKSDIEDAPVEDVVKVVRCKDCKHRDPIGYKCLRDNLWHDTDDFCSYGERRAENEEM